MGAASRTAYTPERARGAQYSLRRLWPGAMIDDMREIEVVSRIRGA